MSSCNTTSLHVPSIIQSIQEQMQSYSSTANQNKNGSNRNNHGPTITTTVTTTTTTTNSAVPPLMQLKASMKQANLCDVMVRYVSLLFIIFPVCSIVSHISYSLLPVS